MENLQDRMKKVLAESGCTHEELAAATGLGATRIGNMTRGVVKNLREDEAEAIQRKFGWRVSWLRFGKGAQRLTKEEQALLCGEAAPLPALARATKLLAGLDGVERGVSDFVQRAMVAFSRRDEAEFEGVLVEGIKALRAMGTALSERYVEVPRYDVAAAAGGGCLIQDEAVVDYLAFQRGWVINAMGLDPDHLALIDIDGDSMDGTINDGDLVLIDCRPGRGFTNGIYVIQFMNRLLCKRLHFKLTGELDVISDNDAYPVETLKPEEMERLTVVGRVVWTGGRV